MRIKKSSSFEVRFLVIKAYQLGSAIDREQRPNSEKKSMLDSLFENLVSNTLNDPSLLEDIDRLYNLPTGVVDLMEEDGCVSITKVNKI